MKLTKFMDPLPLLPVMKPAGRTGDGTYYEVRMTQFKQSLHSELQESLVWGYEGFFPGPTFEVQRGERILVKWMNQLPDQHLFPIDHTVHGAERDKPDVRTVVHVHGGRTKPGSDGYPEAWFTNGYKEKGKDFSSEIYEYDNAQRACTLWYHDHALGITRLNVYAGLAGMYIIRDTYESSLNLPAGDYEIPLLIQDKSFNPDGSLFYPDQPRTPVPGVQPSISPEFLGDAITVNGKVWPFLEVEPRKYRFRILNASNSRFFGLKLSNGQNFYQIGTDGGLLEKPIILNQFIISPAERADVIIDFTNQNGQSIILLNDAPTPFPNGEKSDPETTGIVMKFLVSKELKQIDTSVIPAYLKKYRRINVQKTERQRFLTLDEEKDQYGRPIHTLDKKKWDAPISENPRLGATEVWHFINLTNNSHPMHLHLIHFQLLGRRPFDVKEYKNNGKLIFTGAYEPPLPYENGWKDVIQTPPDMVTSIIAKFKPYTGQYVWHCHILEHEDYEMMRPYIVLPRPSPY
ncbi:multicopper oxidase family protein [Falsibacillus albus]|uniref:Multicopper oxidase family protein n=1 Tax=Falsibacillus albus TaxID=2478915 RepID=A0A3L7JVC4_9BACI|nr:multicopper oxidase [Falsibacillus albus]RLQ94069.1 multicopper oxidase family protein [Falsibacillus albus]